MKKLLAILALSLGATSAMASVTFQRENIPNDVYVFITSLTSGTRISASNEGSFDVVPDWTLKGYPKGSPFAAGISRGSVIQYCQSPSSSQQFKFALKVVTDNSILISMKTNNRGEKVLICEEKN